MVTLASRYLCLLDAWLPRYARAGLGFGLLGKLAVGWTGLGSGDLGGVGARFDERRSGFQTRFSGRHQGSWWDAGVKGEVSAGLLGEL